MLRIILSLVSVLFLTTFGFAQEAKVEEVKRPGDAFHVRVALKEPASPKRLTLLFRLKGEPLAAQERMPVAFRHGGFNDRFVKEDQKRFLVSGSVPEGLASGVYVLEEISIEETLDKPRVLRGKAIPKMQIRVENNKVEVYDSIQKPIEDKK